MKEKVLGLPGSAYEFYTFNIVEGPNSDGFVTCVCVDHEYDTEAIGEFYDLHVDLLVTNVIKTQSGVDIPVPVTTNYSATTSSSFSNDMLIAMSII